MVNMVNIISLNPKLSYVRTDYASSLREKFGVSALQSSPSSPSDPLRLLTADEQAKCMINARIRRADAPNRELGRICRAKMTTPGQGISSTEKAVQGPKKGTFSP